MRVAFVHQNMPGQFGRLAADLAADPRHQVAFVTGRSDRELPGVLRVSYDLRLPDVGRDPPLGSRLHQQSLYGDAVVKALQALLSRGFRPDVIVGHPGWGELMFVKDLLPDVPLVDYCEFYHAPTAPYFAGDPPAPLSAADRMKRRGESAHLLLSLEAADRGWSPTQWQKSVHPAAYQDKIDVIFDGVDSDRLAPDPAATFDLKNGRKLSQGEEVLTYAARSLEPTRGFPSFYRALEELLRRRPQLQVVIAGDERPHYDPPPAHHRSWADKLREDGAVDASRVHFLGRLPHDRFVRMLQVSKLHVYLTTPTVLSWSMVEAMSVGCPVLGSATPPVKEFIREGDTGHLVRFDDPRGLADKADRLLGGDAQPTARRARQQVLDRLSVKTCVPAQQALLERVAAA